MQSHEAAAARLRAAHPDIDIDAIIPLTHQDQQEDEELAVGAWQYRSSTAGVP